MKELDLAEPAALDVAFLCPFPMDGAQSGGAMSHVAGFLSGLARCSVRCEIFSKRPIPISFFPVHEFPSRRRFYVLREALALSHNWNFVSEIEKKLAGRVPSFIYQRHGRYVVAGALLSRRLRRPLVLEYNGSEVWISKHWDPAKFLPWLRVCEEASLAAAAVITVVSDALRQELIERGIPERKILVNPNGVSPDIFHLDCGGNEIRHRLGFAPDQVVVGFIGTFSYWHGIAVLQEAIAALLCEQESGRLLPELRFLLVGDGPLSPEIRAALELYSKRRGSRLPGNCPTSKHLAISMLPIFWFHRTCRCRMESLSLGHQPSCSNTWLWARRSCASNLDQLAQVLAHQKTAWLVKPGSAAELAHAIRLLAAAADMRSHLGKNAREAAVSHHTWQQNAANVLSRFAQVEAPPTVLVRNVSVTE